MFVCFWPDTGIFVYVHIQMHKAHFEGFWMLGQIFMSLPPISSWDGWGYRYFHSISNLEVGSRNRTQVVRLAQHAHLPAKPELGSVHFKHRPLGLACRHSKSWCIYASQRVCAFLLSSYLIMYHQPFLVKVKHKINYAVCDNLFMQGFFLFHVNVWKSLNKEFDAISVFTVEWVMKHWLLNILRAFKKLTDFSLAQIFQVDLDNNVWNDCRAKGMMMAKFSHFGMHKNHLGQPKHRFAGTLWWLWFGVSA